LTAFAEGRRAEALDRIRKAIRLDPEDASSHGNLGLVLGAEGRRAEALEEAHRALRLDPTGCAAKPDLQGLMMRLGRGDEWHRAWREELAADPPGHGARFGYAELCLFLGDEAEYRRERRGLLDRFGATTDPNIAHRAGRACLLMPGSRDEMQQAVALVDRAIAARDQVNEWTNRYFSFSKGLAEYRLGRFDAAIALMEGDAHWVLTDAARLVVAMARHRLGQEDRARKTLAWAVLDSDWSAEKADALEAWYSHILRREAEAMILPKLPAFLQGNYQPRDNDERLALVGACQSKGRRRAEAKLYAAAFAADPDLPRQPPRGLLYRAARAAAVAGRGGGADGTRLGEAERARWRRQARSWLRAELDAWANGLAADRSEVERAQASWRADPDLAGLRDPQAIDKLPAAEREECLALWSDLDAWVGRFVARRGEFFPLPLEKVATIVTTRGMFYDEQAQTERLVFADWSPKVFEGVPFRLVDPSGGSVPNAIMLHGLLAKLPPAMPRSVRVPCHATARAIHFLSGVSGWGYPTLAKGSVSMTVRLHYEGGVTEDHPLRNGEHFADYDQRVDVPGSKFAFRLGGQQLRYLAVFPHRAVRIEEIELIKGPDDTAPIVMAITVEGR
jgi:tetratricopeptide (TPR) repeat protein